VVGNLVKGVAPLGSGAAAAAGALPCAIDDARWARRPAEIGRIAGVGWVLGLVHKRMYSSLADGTLGSRAEGKLGGWP
jgi:hypothetical protein